MSFHRHNTAASAMQPALAACLVAIALACGCGTAQPPAAEVGAERTSAPATESDRASTTAKGPVAASEGDADEPPSPLGKDWIFTWLDGFHGTLPSPPPVAGFIMTREGQRLTGTTACNRMGSGYELSVYDGTLRFTKLRNTRMMCDRVAADTEQAVLDAMIATDAFRIMDGKLELLSNGKVVARLTAP